MRSTAVVHRRPLVTVVGPFSQTRVELARHLLDGGAAVSLCAGPPSCSLLRGEPCALLETADATVVLPPESHASKVVSGLALCAKNAPRCIVVEPSTIDVKAHVAHVRFSNVDRLASFVRSVLHYPSRGAYTDSRARED